VKPLNAVDLRHQLKIRRKTSVDSLKGGYVTSWPVVASPWAEVTGLDGRESVMDQVLQGISVYRIRIRWRGDIAPQDQVRFGSIDLNIKSAVDPDGKRQQLVIMADTAGVELMADG
jgi:SPP1 family predicted phage head-tail adaptor